MREPHFEREMRAPGMERREEGRGEHHEERHDGRDDAHDKGDAERRDHDEAREHRDDAGRDAGREDAARRDLANRDLSQPVNAGHWNQNVFWNNQWGGHVYNCAGCRWGWAAGVFWPFALGDVFSYAWWPYAGPPAFWDYGLNVMLTGLFWPNGVYAWPDGYGAYAWSGDGSGYRVTREARQSVYSGGPADAPVEAQAPDTAAPQAAQTCSGLAPGVGVLPMDRIEKAVEPTESQRVAFEELSTASAKAAAILNSACPSDAPLTPVGRIDALDKRLRAMDEAVDGLITPFSAFSKSLSDDQRRALGALGGPQSTKADPLQMSDVGGCADEGQQFTDVPVQQIEQSVKPDAQQQAALDKLKAVSAQAAEKLRSTCPTSVAASPEARMQEMDQRLHDTIVAVNDVRPALVAFYDSLNDEQKARFDTLPQEQAAQKP
jgi:hypothetical protein